MHPQRDIDPAIRRERVRLYLGVARRARRSRAVGPTQNVLAMWRADTDEWTYQHRVARKRATQQLSEQLAKMFEQAGAMTRRTDEP
jgi:hypothetical protein